MSIVSAKVCKRLTYSFVIVVVEDRLSSLVVVGHRRLYSRLSYDLKPTSSPTRTPAVSHG
jgi:hypothetical protein